jgi:hypothetical protein
MMTEATEEGLRRLYWACRNGSDFPGEIPDESNGFVATTAVLEALGINVPTFGDMNAPEDIERPIPPIEYDARIQFSSPLELDISVVQKVADEQDDSTIESIADNLPGGHEQECRSSTTTSSELVTPIQSTMHQPLTTDIHPPLSTLCQASETLNFIHTPLLAAATEPLFHMEAIPNMGSYVVPAGPTTLHQFCKTTQPYMHSKVVNDCISHVQGDQYVPELMNSCFLAPWPGSLASALLSMSAL